MSHRVSVGDKIIALVDKPNSADVPKGAVMVVNNLYLSDDNEFTAVCERGITWVFGDSCFVNEKIAIYVNINEHFDFVLTDFELKRLSYFRRAAEKAEYVQLGKGDVDVLDRLLKLMGQKCT